MDVLSALCTQSGHTYVHKTVIIDYNIALCDLYLAIRNMYMLKHCRECYVKNKTRGAWLSALFSIQHKQGNALNDLWNFLVV